MIWVETCLIPIYTSSKSWISEMAKDKDNGCELFKLSSIFCSIKTKSGLTYKIFFNIDSYLFFSL